MEGKGELRGRRASLGQQVLRLPTLPSILGDPECQKAGDGAWAGAGGEGSHQCQTSGPGSWVLAPRVCPDLRKPGCTGHPLLRPELLLSVSPAPPGPFPGTFPRTTPTPWLAGAPASPLVLVLALPSGCLLHVLSLGFWNSGRLLGQGVL